MKNYTILVIAALPVEIKEIKNICKSLGVSWISLKFLHTGVGNYNTIFEVQKYLQNHDVDFMVNIWVCGKKSDQVSDSVFQVYRIKHLHNSKESLCPLYITTGDLCSIGCSEKVVTDQVSLGEENYVDMESYGIDFIAKRYKIAHTIIKFPFDVVSEASKQVDIELLKTLLRNYNYTQLFENIRSWCHTNIQETPDWDSYKVQFGLSVAQLEIFKRHYNKLIAFWKDPKAFLEQEKHTPKKILLQKMRDTDDL